MSSYDQGRMDAWERIDAIKRRLGLAGFFNEQKIKRYPKGHPKAGEFMPKPKEGKKPVKAKKIFNLNLSPIKTTIGSHSISLSFGRAAGGISINLSVDGSLDTVENMSSAERRKAALWWRRSAVEAAKMMPDGVPLHASAYGGDGRGQDRVDFYKALGFHASGSMVSAITKGGKITPTTRANLREGRKVVIRDLKLGHGKPSRTIEEFSSQQTPRSYSQEELQRASEDLFGFNPYADPSKAERLQSSIRDKLLSVSAPLVRTKNKKR